MLFRCCRCTRTLTLDESFCGKIHTPSRTSAPERQNIHRLSSKRPLTYDIETDPTRSIHMNTSECRTVRRLRDVLNYPWDPEKGKMPAGLMVWTRTARRAGLQAWVGISIVFPYR